MKKLGASDDDISDVSNNFKRNNEEISQSDLIVWPQNYYPVSIFLACSTQWERHVMDGSFIKLSWDSVETAMRRRSDIRNLSQDEQDAIFWDVETMERTALNEMYLIRKEQKDD